MTQINVAQTLDEAQEHRSGIGTKGPGSPRPSVLAAAGGFPHAVGASGQTEVLAVLAHGWPEVCRRQSRDSCYHLTSGQEAPKAQPPGRSWSQISQKTDS